MWWNIHQTQKIFLPCSKNYFRNISLSISRPKICWKIILLNDTIVFSFLESWKGSKRWLYIEIHDAQWTHGATNLITDDLRTRWLTSYGTKTPPRIFIAILGVDELLRALIRLLIGQLTFSSSLLSLSSSFIESDWIPKGLDSAQSWIVWR